jgi:predicted glycosyltransferase
MIASRHAPPAFRQGDGRPVILHYCHHSVGLGHLVRSLAVAGALAERNRVVLCSGGRVPSELAVPAGVEIVPLPPIGTGPGGDLVSHDPALTVDEAFARRAWQLLRCFGEADPDAVIVELFPFGRRKFAAELFPLLERARHRLRRPVVVCSVRDLLVSGHPDKQRHDDEAAARLDAYFDAVIVHGDPRFALLEETFHPSVPARVPVFYSGFVTARTAPPQVARPRPGQVVVSAGGGLVGGALFRAAAEAHRSRLRCHGLTTRIVTGPFLPEDEFGQLRTQARTVDGLSVERFVPDLCEVMASSAVSVSQCGYNTSIDLLLSGTPAVVVPYGEGGEDEQAGRALRLAALGVVNLLPAAELSAAGLAEEILRLVGRPRRTAKVAIGGAARTALLVDSLLAPHEDMAR